MEKTINELQMKYIIILGDGMADEPIGSLGGRTPLQAACKPSIDRVAALGRSGMLATVPAGFAPGSEIANLSVLGYDLPKVFEGRGSLEAASMGVRIEDGEMAMRCNLLTIEQGRIKNHSAGHITSEEAAELIVFLQKELGGGDANFFPGVSYRHLLKLKGGRQADCDDASSRRAGDSVPGCAGPGLGPRSRGDGRPHQRVGRAFAGVTEGSSGQPGPSGGRQGAPANSIWPWSPGYRPQMETLMQRYGIRDGVVISAVDLIKGIGVYAGLKPVDVEGATGLYTTNYEGKARAALDALRTHDFVFLHIEASDEAGHEGDAELKVRTIEYLDSRVVKTILDEISGWDEPVSMAILPVIRRPAPCGRIRPSRYRSRFTVLVCRATACSVSTSGPRRRAVTETCRATSL